MVSFNPRSPCGERRSKRFCALAIDIISIHALLAESDEKINTNTCIHSYFNPRSPCGERQINFACLGVIKLFQSTLSLRRATLRFNTLSICKSISIHALLAESDIIILIIFSFFKNFNPRSPCGERPTSSEPYSRAVWISIHALLAESD